MKDYRQIHDGPFCTISIDLKSKELLIEPKDGFTIYDLDHNPDDLESLLVEFDLKEG